MKPQTRALNIGKYGCLAYCYLYCSGMMTSESSSYEMICKAMEEGLLDDECFVKSASDLLKFFTGKRMKVTKKDISSIDGIKKRTPVRYDYRGNSHWVVVEGGLIVFDSLEDSQCVKFGKPTTARIIDE